MSNLIRGPQDYLLNTVNGSTVGMYVDSDGVKHLVIKKYGLDIPYTANTKAVVKKSNAGTKQKLKLAIDFLWNGEANKLFEIEVTKQPLYTGRGDQQFPISHTYSFLLTSFSTSTEGTLDNTDKDAIVNGLIAQIAKDVQLNSNAVSTGACVVGTLVNHELVLEAKEVGTLFTVRTYNSEFTNTQITPFQKATLTNDDILRIFSVKA